MRQLRILLGVVPLGACAAAGFRIIAGPPASPPLIIERGAVPLPVASTAPAIIPSAPAPPARITPAAPVNRTSERPPLPRREPQLFSGGGSPPVLPPADPDRTVVVLPAPVIKSTPQAPRSFDKTRRTDPSPVDKPIAVAPILPASAVEATPATGEAEAEVAEETVPAVSAQQCRGATRSGERCRRKTRDATGFCYQHRAQSAP